jgi:UDP-glucose 4-epimerase
VKEIADLAVERLELSGVEYEFTGGARGWKGDVPVVRFDTQKVRALGWSNTYTSRQALEAAIDAAITESARESELRGSSRTTRLA